MAEKLLLRDKITSLIPEDFQGRLINMTDQERRCLPQPTPENMLILMNKINELTEQVNALTKIIEKSL